VVGASAEQGAAAEGGQLQAGQVELLAAGLGEHLLGGLEDGQGGVVEVRRRDQPGQVEPVGRGQLALQAADLAAAAGHRDGVQDHGAAAVGRVQVPVAVATARRIEGRQWRGPLHVHDVLDADAQPALEVGPRRSAHVGLGLVVLVEYDERQLG
jgi:hypothetical protein